MNTYLTLVGRRLWRSSISTVFFLAACSGSAQHVATSVGGEPPKMPVVRNQATDAPSIAGLWISRDTFGSGDAVRGEVTTSSNVASVEARVGGYSMPMQREDFGRFRLSYQVPHLPSFLKRDFQLDVIARNSVGASATATLPIHVR